MKVWFFGLSAGLSFILLITAGSINSTEIQEQACLSSAMDSDGDGMSDAYELFYGLNSTNPADVLLDYDGDALTNLAESVKLTDPFCEDTDRDGFFDDMDEKISRAYIQWGSPQFTTGDEYEYAHPDWLLGAYKNGGEWVATTQVWGVSGYGSNGMAISSGWRVSACESNGVGSLNIDLDRTILTNNLRYAIHYLSPIAASATGDSAGSNASLYVDLLDTNSVILAENLFGNLLTGSNVTRHVVIPAPVLSNAEGEAGIQSDNIVLLNIPTATTPDAAVIQLRACHSRPPASLCEALRAGESGNPVPSTEAGRDSEIFVYEGLLYIDEDGDGLDADQERQIGTSDYSVDSNGNGTNDYDERFNTGSSTNNPDGGGGGNEPGEDDEDQDNGHGKKKIIYVDQAIGNDQFTGRASAVTANKGPKKTVRGGMAIAETNDTVIIRSGDYNENLNIIGKDVKVVIEGKVRL